MAHNHYAQLAIAGIGVAAIIASRGKLKGAIEKLFPEASSVLKEAAREPSLGNGVRADKNVRVRVGATVGDNVVLGMYAKVGRTLKVNHVPAGTRIEPFDIFPVPSVRAT